MITRHISESYTEHAGWVEKEDLNGYGLMHGGRLLTICDDIGYLAAKKHAGCDCLTRAVHDAHFQAMMREGDHFKVEAKIVLTGKTTLWASCCVNNDKQTVMRAVFVYIAVDPLFAPVSIAEIHPQGENEWLEQQRMRELMNRVVA